MADIRTALAAAALAAAALAVPSPAAADDLPRVLIVGDSITQGLPGDVTWRYHLWDAFDGGIDLVGPMRGQYGPGGSQVVDQYPHPFDVDHAARWGMPLSAMVWPIGDLVETYDPDVVVEELGHNDLAYYGHTPESLAVLVEDFVADARAAKPDVDVVLGQLAWTWDPPVQQFNALLLDVAAELDTPAARVVVATMPPMTYADTYDNAHPNAAGEVKIAAAHEAALRGLGLVNAAPVPVLERPAAPRVVHAARAGAARVTVRWPRVAGATAYVARCGKARRDVTRPRVWLRATRPASCRVRAVNAAGASPWTWSR